MSHVKMLNVPCHQQDTGDFCGAACAQMVLEQMGKGVQDQAHLYSLNQTNTIVEKKFWTSGPDGLATTMTAQGRKPFAAVQLLSEDQISRNIAWAIEQVAVPPIALVQHYGHWVVVTGYSADRKPTGSSDLGFSIPTFDVNDPQPYLHPSYDATPPLEPPHATTDGCPCRGWIIQNIGVGKWQDDYMKGVSTGHYSGKFIAVCDPEPGSEGYGARFPPPLHPPAEKWATPEEAIEAIKSAFDDYGLASRQEWEDALAGTVPGTSLLVERLDRTDVRYYLVPMEVGSPARVPVVASVDAATGRYNPGSTAS